jgi:phage terminase large subunit-like protein
MRLLKKLLKKWLLFPYGENDDFADSATMALMRIRQGGLIELGTDYEDEVSFDRRKLSYY